MACYASCKVDELEGIRNRLLGEAFGKYRLQYDSLALGPIEVAMRELFALSYVGQRFLTSKGHIADGKSCNRRKPRRPCCTPERRQALLSAG